VLVFLADGQRDERGAPTGASSISSGSRSGI
jgi:hypothetical protein